MELFLNILWVLIALAALAVWRYQWKRQECGATRKSWQQWTAFACALVFVFFAVSLSDDLHAAAILADDCASGRHHSLTWTCDRASHSDACSSHVGFAAGPVFVFENSLGFAGEVTPSTFVFGTSNERLYMALRGPPSFSP
jgi:hypothetical protein